MSQKIKARADIFSRDDVALLKAPNDVPVLLERAATSLVEFIETAPRYPAESGLYGRFCFSSYSESAAQIRAALRVCNLALVFLNADFLACEVEMIAHLRGELAAFEAMRGGGE